MPHDNGHTNCEECNKMLRQGHWRQIPAGYGSNVTQTQAWQAWGNAPQQDLCEAHRLEAQEPSPGPGADTW